MIKKILSYPLHIFLFTLAWLLMLPLSIINFIIVIFKANNTARGYFLSTALSIDILANREFRTLWNVSLCKVKGYKFGISGETISSALGKNQRDKTLTITGKLLAWILDCLDRKHCEKSITNF